MNNEINGFLDSKLSQQNRTPEEIRKLTFWSSRKHHLWWPISFTKYEVTGEKILREKGLISTDYDEFWLYKAMDIKLRRGLMQKIFRTGTVEVIGYDATDPVFFLENVKEPKKVKELLSTLILASKQYNSMLEVGNPAILDGNNDGFPDFIS